MKVRMTLGIGYHNANHEDVVDVDDDEWAECETDHDRDELLGLYWRDWSNNYIDGGWTIIGEDK